MKNEDIIECCKAIIDFLLDNDSSWPLNVFPETPKNKIMKDVLKKHRELFMPIIYKNTDCFSMTEFVIWANAYFGYNDVLWGESAREFLSTGRALSFLRRIIRDIQLDKILD